MVGHKECEELRLRGGRGTCGIMAVVAAAGVAAAGVAAVEGIVGVADSRQSGGVGVSRRTSCCSGPPLLLDSVARVVIGAAAEQSRSASEMVGHKECEELRLRG